LLQDKPKAAGYLTFTLHAHLPYVVNHGTWPHGIEWLHEAAAETYLPLLRVLGNLERDGIPVEVVTDNMIASLFAAHAIDVAIVGADRIAKNGDVANKIGTYGVACLARLHDVAFYVAAPWSTVDLATATGAGIPIEERDEQEVSHIADVRVMPDNVHARNRAFDVTPARLVDAIFTERGAAAPPSEATLAPLAR